jgi:glycosidase
MANSIPIVYYGQEQGLDGSGDPVRSWSVFVGPIYATTSSTTVVPSGRLDISGRPHTI